MCYGNIIVEATEADGDKPYLDYMNGEVPNHQTWQPLAYGRPEVYRGGAWQLIVDDGTSSGSFWSGIGGSIFIGGAACRGRSGAVWPVLGCSAVSAACGGRVVGLGALLGYLGRVWPAGFPPAGGVLRNGEI